MGVYKYSQVLGNDTRVGKRFPRRFPLFEADRVRRHHSAINDLAINDSTRPAASVQQICENIISLRAQWHLVPGGFHLDTQLSALQRS